MSLQGQTTGAEGAAVNAPQGVIVFVGFKYLWTSSVDLRDRRNKYLLPKTSGKAEENSHCRASGNRSRPIRS